MNKILIGGLIFLVIVLIVGACYVIFNKETKKEPEIYQGPVKPTDDEEHFRRTGITKPMEIKG